VREKYCWLVTGDWFVLKEKYCWWLEADKPNEQAVWLLGPAWFDTNFCPTKMGAC
jgi:hypothetical protein